MSKTPYEIRLEILRLANDILCNDHNNIRSELEQRYHFEYEKDHNAKYPSFPKAPTTEDVLAEAERLNKFVSNT